MNHASFFAGIGGFDLAAQWMGWTNKIHCEINPFARNILKYYWPKAHSYEDIKKTDFKRYLGQIDVVSGGFPCQPYSQAGKRKGTADDRHLWPDMLRSIKEIRPTWVVAENVRGLLNWNDGLVFDEVQTDLEAAGYQVIPFILPASGVNAPHRRYRVWFVAYAGGNGLKSGEPGKDRPAPGASESKGDQWQRFRSDIGRIGQSWLTANAHIHQYPPEVTGGFNLQTDLSELYRTQYGTPGQSGRTDNDAVTGMGVNRHAQRNAANPDDKGLQGGSDQRTLREKRTQLDQRPDNFFCTDWQDFPTQPPLCTGNDGFSPELDGITFPKWRNESIKAAGNAIVPQIAYQIFQAIEIFELL